jgi:MoxR-like ATPase
MAILSAFADNRRLIVQGRHGTGKSTHIEQVAARLNWPLIRVNLDSHISRIDLIGKDAFFGLKTTASFRTLTMRSRRPSSIVATRPSDPS